MSASKRLRIEVGGRVQGVGFRPAVYRRARERGLGGWVTNTAEGVVIEVEGPAGAVRSFTTALKASPPPAARVRRFASRELAAQGVSEFVIRPSPEAAEVRTEVSPDRAPCSDCLRELDDPRDRRRGYPFLNCTDCGPRFTIVRGVPYDRARTTMDVFPMCARCRAEYLDPGDRRFHAQPTACPECGPRVRLVGADGSAAAGGIARGAELLREGRILAVKGLGGFHLACDARSEEAVRVLRGRKFREDKPFALMARDARAVRRFCHCDAQETALLESAARPIVLLRKKEGGALAPSVAPGQPRLGFMLPYTPLHHLLFTGGAPSPLVMTSGNVSDEPIAHRDDDALARLSGLADFFLLHDRDIHVRCDDSVCRVSDGEARVLRRSRGYVPAPVRLPVPVRRPVLACGAELKNTFCLARGSDALLSHHIGDLANLEARGSFESGIAHFERVFRIAPEVLACDLSPDSPASRYARARGAKSGLRLIEVQHHHAHVAACMADNGVSGKVIGVAFDGAGFGPDGTVWGGEFLIADHAGYERAAHLKPVAMPGGDAAVRQVWRMAASHLEAALGPGFLGLDIDFVRRLDREKWDVLSRAARSGVQSPPTSSMGRLFDAIAALTGVRDAIRYEGQAAVELETLAGGGGAAAPYPFGIVGEELPFILDPAPVLTAIVADLRAGVPAGRISARFHRTASDWTVAVCRRLRAARGLGRVALSGGVFQNELLRAWTARGLRDAGFQVFTHRQVPTNDGGLCLGQALVAGGG